MASCDPIESPSGRACEVSTNRCRLRMASQMRRTMSGGLSSGTALASVGWVMFSRGVRSGIGRLGRRARGLRLRRTAGALLLEIAEDLLDPVVLLDALVEEEVQLRRAAQPDPSGQLPAKKRG